MDNQSRILRKKRASQASRSSMTINTFTKLRRMQATHVAQPQQELQKKLPLPTTYNSRWTTCGRKLLRDSKAFFVRGVNYAPTPIGHPPRLDLLNDTRIFTRDLANLRAMHANAVKTYDFYSDVDHTAFLDAAFNNGDRPIYTIFSIWIDEELMRPHVSIHDRTFLNVVESYYDMARLTGGHPGVMGYSIGGEMNRHWVVTADSFWEKFAVVTRAVRRGLADSGYAQKLITTTFMDDSSRSFRAGAPYNPDVDMWGANVYQSAFAGVVIPTFMGIPGGKPLLVSEYGFPYANDKSEGDAQELQVVAQALVNQTIAMQSNYNQSDVLQQQIVVGGFVFEYSDEWWKAGDPDKHDLGGTKSRDFPLGYWSEEYFGLYGAIKSNSSSSDNGSETVGVDELYARPTVALLTALWSTTTLAHEGVDYTFCNHTAADIQAKRDVEIYGKRSIGVIGSLLIALALGIVGLIGFTLYRARMRRAHYQSISSRSLQ